MNSQHRLTLAAILEVVSAIGFIVAVGALIYSFSLGPGGWEFSTRSWNRAMRFLLDLGGGGRLFFSGLIAGAVGMVIGSRLRRSGVRLG